MFNKFLMILLAIAILFAIIRALFKPQRRKIWHENMKWIAKIVLMVMVMAACIALYRRYF